MASASSSSKALVPTQTNMHTLASMMQTCGVVRSYSVGVPKSTGAMEALPVGRDVLQLTTSARSID